MTIGQVETAYQTHKDTPCPITERLIESGYQQTSGGYIARAKACGETVDYRIALPHQWWHLMTYCRQRDPNQAFTRSIVCGELIFWMGEVSGLVSANKLNALVDDIIDDGNKTGTTVAYDRRKWNKAIQETCFTSIEKYVETCISV